MDDAKLILKIIPGTKIALFHWIGPITAMDRIHNLKKIVDFCSDKDIKSVIADGRDQVPNTDIRESFNFGAMVAKVLRNYNIAVVHKFNDDNLSYIENAAIKRGATLKSFLKIEEARAWLESIPNKVD